MMPLTARQSEVLELIRRHVREHGYQPSLREMAKELGMASPTGALSHLKALERKGFVRLVPSASRSVELIGETDCCAACGHKLKKAKRR
jgi:repressor LexA